MAIDISKTSTINVDLLSIGDVINDKGRYGVVDDIYERSGLYVIDYHEVTFDETGDLNRCVAARSLVLTDEDDVEIYEEVQDECCFETV